jgi:capsular polysaccharide export protein
VPPWSLCLDRGAYFDASRPSDLEQMLNRHKPDDLSDAERATARQLMETLKALQIDKYNLASTSALPDPLSIPADAILVLGQVEDDFSILRNSNAISTNAGLLQRALDENPGRTIFFKQHPDCVGVRKRPGHVALSGFKCVREIPSSMPVAEAIDAVEMVYTISSLGGFEALMRGKKVVTFGAPFYAGWGLTRDHVSFPRRQNRLALDDLFYIAYVVYPHYFNPHDGTRLEAGDVIRKMVDLRAS